MLRKLICSLAFLSFSLPLWSQEPIKLLTYHVHPPFVNGPQEGLTYSLAQFLTQRSEGRFSFEVEELPRKRLDLAIQKEGSWVALWSNPIWFGDAQQEKYLWVPVMEDNSVILSPGDAPVNWESPDSLRGMTFVGMRGHRYVGIDDLVEAGEITRIDNNQEQDIVRMLLNHRADAGLLPGSAMRYFAKQMELGDRIYVAPKPHSTFQRMFFTPRSRADLAEFLKTLRFAQNPEWQALLASYGF